MEREVSPAYEKVGSFGERVLFESDDLVTAPVSRRRLMALARYRRLSQGTVESHVRQATAAAAIVLVGQDLREAFSRWPHIPQYKAVNWPRHLSLRASGNLVSASANYEEAALLMCEIEGCNLNGIRLQRAILSGSNLRNTSQRFANLNEAILQEVCLEGADLSFASLINAALPNANLQGANLSTTLLTSAVFDGANLREVNLTDAILDGASFYQADLTGADFRGASLKGVDFEQAKGVPESVLRQVKVDLGATQKTGSKSSANEAIVFYGTDREPRRGDRPNYYYGKQLADPSQLSLGFCAVSLPKGRNTGDNLRPWIPRNEDEDEHIVLKSVKELAVNDFTTSLNQAVTKAEQPEVLLFVHGFNVSFAYAARCLAQFVEDIGFRGVPLLYSWSSHGSLSLLSYNHDAESVKLARHTLVPLLRMVRKCQPIQRLHIMAHSMGARAVLDSFRELGEEELYFDELVFAAPDVSQPDFRQTLDGLKKNPAQHVSLYAAGKDLALAISKFLAKFIRAGQANPLLVMNGVETIDASKVDGGGLRHSYFSISRPVVTDLNSLIIGKMRPDKRPLVRSERQGIRYWIFRS